MNSMKKILKKILLKPYTISHQQFGLDPLKFIKAVFALPRFFKELIIFRLKFKGKLEISPILNEYNAESGNIRDEYFWQDLLVAQKIFIQKPNNHFDIGSRVDGFIAHLSSFREVNVLDIRPLPLKIPNCNFFQVDVMDSSQVDSFKCDSLSCLHTIEHFGLGRYGDPINPTGYATGLKNMAKMLQENGHLYLSTPIGKERVEFNANRVFDPRTIINLANDNDMDLIELTCVYQSGSYEVIDPTEVKLKNLAMERYSLGIFIFKKRGM